MKEIRAIIYELRQRLGIVPFCCFMVAAVSASANCYQCIGGGGAQWFVFPGCLCPSAPRCTDSTEADKCTPISEGAVTVHCTDSFGDPCDEYTFNCRTDDGGNCGD
jgi:hypothetical protein